MTTFKLLESSISKFKRGLNKSAGRNHTGKITVYHRGGGFKKSYRSIDIWRRLDCQGTVLGLFTDSFRNGKVALVLYLNGILAFVLAADGLSLGSSVWSGSAWPVKVMKEVSYNHSTFSSKGLFVGSSIPVGFCSIGALVSNIELKAGFGAQLCRSAGTSAIIVKKTLDNKRVVIRLKSGVSIVLSASCMVTLGVVSNGTVKFFKKLKAGVSRNKGRRPVVRGVAMNPVDHPHGGGEGKASGGKSLKTPWGFGTKGYKTVSRSVRVRKARTLKRLLV